MSKSVRFYFDYISPYSFFSWKRRALITQIPGVRVSYHPVLFAGLLEHFDQKGPAEVQPKRAHMWRKITRYAGKNNIPLRGPAAHPFNPLLALRTSLPSVTGDKQEAVIDCLFEAGWVKGIDMQSEEQIAKALDEAGLDGHALVTAAKQDKAKEGLRQSTADAIHHGVFGVPTMVASVTPGSTISAAGTSSMVFWGNDEMEDLRDFLLGKDKLDMNTYQRLLTAPIGAQRKDHHHAHH